MSLALKKTRVDAALLTVTDARRRAVFLSTCVPFFVGRPAGRSASWSVWNRRTVLVSLDASLLDGGCHGDALVCFACLCAVFLCARSASLPVQVVDLFEVATVTRSAHGLCSFLCVRSASFPDGSWTSLRRSRFHFGT